MDIQNFLLCKRDLEGYKDPDLMTLAKHRGITAPNKDDLCWLLSVDILGGLQRGEMMSKAVERIHQRIAEAYEELRHHEVITQEERGKERERAGAEFISSINSLVDYFEEHPGVQHPYADWRSVAFEKAIHSVERAYQEGLYDEVYRRGGTTTRKIDPSSVASSVKKNLLALQHEYWKKHRALKKALGEQKGYKGSMRGPRSEREKGKISFLGPTGGEIAGYEEVEGYTGEWPPVKETTKKGIISFRDPTGGEIASYEEVEEEF